MSKRKNGEGTWGKKKIKGYDYIFYRDIDGKYTYGKTQKDVKEKLAKQAERFELTNKTTFGEYILNWLESKRTIIEPTTYDCYETMINSLIINFKGYDISTLQMQQINQNEFQEYLNALAKKYARSTISKIWVIIKECIKYAEVKKEIQSNTTTFVKVPIESNVKVKKKEIPFLSMEDADKLYNVAKSGYGNNAQALMLIMYTGMRVSEAIALKWENVDISNKKIYIKESAANIINRGDGDNKYISYDKTTKTSDSTRTIPLPDRALEAIKYFSLQNPKHKKTDYVCVTNKRTKMERRNINRTLYSMASKAKCSVQDFSVHTLRHTYGSILIANGVDIKVLGYVKCGICGEKYCFSDIF